MVDIPAVPVGGHVLEERLGFLARPAVWVGELTGGGDCPALCRTEGGYVVQGMRLDDDTRSQLRQLADDEDAVFVPTAVLDRLKGL